MIRPEVIRVKTLRSYAARTHSEPAVWAYVFNPDTRYPQLHPFCNEEGYAHADCRGELRAALGHGAVLKSAVRQ